jgi:hypothetical protein
MEERTAGNGISLPEGDWYDKGKPLAHSQGLAPPLDD